MKHLCISVRWLDSRFHGLLDRGGTPEWPPSPFRLFQALVAGAAQRGELDSETGRSLEWLQSRPPLIIAPQSSLGQLVTKFVPNNDGDKVPDRQRRLTAKTSHPTIIGGEPEVHYVWTTGEDCPARQLIAASRLLLCLGWGIDMAYADGRLLDEEAIRRLRGVRWFPKPGVFREDGMLRLPSEGSMADLRRAHESAIRRTTPPGPLRTVDKPRVFDEMFYASCQRPIGRPYVAFALRTGADDSYRYPHEKLIHIAAMVRSAAIRAMRQNPPETLRDPASWIELFVAGHQTDRGTGHEQFSYIPLSSIGHEHADAMIRRVMVTAPFGSESEIGHLADQLDGMQLEPEGGGPGPILWRLRPDGVTRKYLDVSKAWASVTPIILPGHDDHKPAKTIHLIERALQQSGVDQTCQFTWGVLPNFPNCLTAHRYDQNKRRSGYFRPRYLDSLTALHLRIMFDQPVAGPLSIGAGRHCGFGVLAAVGG